MKRIVDIAGRIQLAVFGLAALLPLAAGASPSFIGIGDASVQQPAAGTVPLTFTLTRSGSNGDTLDTGYPVVVRYSTVNDSAQSGTDYLGTIGSAVIPAGAATATVSVQVLAGSNTVDKSFFLNLASATGVGAAPAFAAPTQVPAAGTLPFQSAAADFNGDGLPDLAVADGATASVTILFNATAAGAASPSFTAAGSVGVGSRPRYIVAADFNGDGKPDLAVGNNSLNVSILFNTTAPGDTSASFTPAGTISLGDFPTSLQVADMNGDGLPDLVLNGSFYGSVNVFLNTTTAGASAAGFSLAFSQVVGNQNRFVTVADYNGDGKPDLATASEGTNAVNILLNTTLPGSSNVSFTPETNFAVGNTPLGLAAGDFNGDGKPDLAVANYDDNTLTILRNTTAPGAMTPSFTPGSPLGAGLEPGVVTVADLNGDGKPDLAVTNFQGGTVTLLYNTTAVGTNAISFLDTIDKPIVGFSVEFITAADFNGDGKADLAVSSEILGSPYPGAGYLSILLNNTPASTATLSFAPAVNVNAGVGGLYFGVVRDFNGDGKPDFAVENACQCGNPPVAALLLNTTAPGSLTASAVVGGSFGVGPAPFNIATADFNGDGRYDLVTATEKDSSLSVLFNNTTPGSTSASFALAGSPVTDPTQGNSSFYVATADFNGDGLPDIVSGNFKNNVSFLFNTTAPGAAAATFAAAGTLNTGAARHLAAADFNGDGKPDVAVVNLFTNSVSVLVNQTAAGAAVGSFAQLGSFALGGPAGGASAIVAGDFNGDGKPDLAVANQDGNLVSILFNTTAAGAASPTFGAPVTMPVGNAPRGLAVGDLDGDGRLDLVSADSGSNTASILRNTTAPGAAVPSFTLASSAAVGGSPQSVAALDFNGDGSADIETMNYDGTVSIVLNTRLLANLSDTFAVGTITPSAADTTPDAFAFIDTTTPAGTSTLSNTITVSGTSAAVPLVLSGPSAAAPQYAINGGKFKYYNTAGGGPKVSNGDTVRLRAISSQSAGTVDLVLSLGSVSDTWTLTTATGANTPNAFDFKDKLNQPANRYIGSGGVRISGINTPVAISISGDPSASFRINSGAYIAGPAMVSNGDLVVLRLKSSATPGAEVTATVSIGGVTDRWTVTTAGTP